MTDVEKLIAEARRIATKGVQVNDGHTYGVHAHDLVEYSETIMALIDVYEATAAELRMRTWQFDDAESVREDNARLAEDAEAERDRYCRAIERVVAVPNEFEWDVPPTAGGILAAALDETKED